LRAWLGIEVTIAIENPGIGKFKFRSGEPAMPIFFDQLSIGEFLLGILVQSSRVGIGRGRIEVVIVFLDIFAMVSFRSGEAEEAFL
jgi:hypothetical protein